VARENGLALRHSLAYLPVWASLCLGGTVYSYEPKLTAALLEERTAKPFKDVIEELEFAISEQNFRITGRNAIGAEIRKRGYPNFPEVEIIHFCNLEHARYVLELDPRFVAHMPCRIAVYQEGNHTVIIAMLLPEDHKDQRVNKFARTINRIIREIVDIAVEKH
jgi:uncharacterized protein (DUF302 family)